MRSWTVRAAWEAAAVSFVSAEGFTQYLPEEAVRELFSTVGERTGAGSVFAFTFVGSFARMRADRRLGHTDKMVQTSPKRGEHWLWAVLRADWRSSWNPPGGA